MEKIFDIAKDSEQSWGTLATAIDGNFEDTAKFLLADKIPCGDNLITQPVELSEGWSYEMVYILIQADTIMPLSFHWLLPMGENTLPN